VQSARRRVTLSDLDESPWGALDGKPLDACRLARLLDRFGVKPGPFKVNGEAMKGYQTAGEHGLADAWGGYLPEQPAPVGYSGYPAVKGLPIPTW
jgi:hypothetical protein